MIILRYTASAPAAANSRYWKIVGTACRIASGTSTSGRLLKNASLVTISAAVCSLTRVMKAASISRSVLAFRLSRTPVPPTKAHLAPFRHLENLGLSAAQSRIAQKLALQWSPEQISGWLKRQLPADYGMQISHEAIYRSLFIQTRGVLKKQLIAHLRTARQMRQAKGGNTKSGLGQIVDTVCIRERPAEAKDRAVPGHWEGDLLTGTNNSHIATLVERHTRFVMLLKIPSNSQSCRLKITKGAGILRYSANYGMERWTMSGSAAVDTFLAQFLHRCRPLPSRAGTEAAIKNVMSSYEAAHLRRRLRGPRDFRGQRAQSRPGHHLRAERYGPR